MPRSRDKGPWFWRGMIGAMVASVFGLFAVAAFSAPPAVDPQTNCRMDRKDPAHTIILIDQSDPFGPNDVDWVSELLDGEARTLPKHGRLTVMQPNAGRPFDPVRLTSVCSTGSPDKANPILSNPRMVADTWRTQFYEPLVETVETAMLDTVEPASPLSEALYAIADRADFQSGQRNRRLIVVSDLMQHSGAFSFYRRGADYGAFRETALVERMPALDGVDVTARIVPRQNYDLPMGEVKAFWRAYFRDTGATYGSLN
ncbi:MAG: hypothetical protein MRY64_15555 [Hyphomonadaceae bacterium]|nr:hypothetical protein [Hyphomonadaceae bacterium]